MGRYAPTHGMSKTPIYCAWKHIFQRCYNPKDKSFKNYGGRGITVCKRWHKFENFYADVGNPPKGMSIDRWPNNNGNYEPSNIRWATRHEQNSNTRPASCGPHKQCWFQAFGPNGEQVISNNQHEFARQHDLSNSNISNCLCERYGCKSVKGWTFRRLEFGNKI